MCFIQHTWPNSLTILCNATWNFRYIWSFKYEHVLQKIKKVIQNSRYPLQEVYNRILEHNTRKWSNFFLRLRYISLNNKKEYNYRLLMSLDSNIRYFGRTVYHNTFLTFKLWKKQKSIFYVTEWWVCYIKKANKPILQLTRDFNNYWNFYCNLYKYVNLYWN